MSFNIKPTNLLPTKYDGVTCSGVVPFNIASLVEDVRATYVQVAPTIQDVDNDFEKAEYLIFNYPNGERSVLPLAFIDEKSITVTDKITMVVEISNISSTSVDEIAASLRQLSINDFKITVK